MSEKKDLNRYLFYEFGLDTEGDVDEPRVSDDWPFELRSVGVTSWQGKGTEVFEFNDAHDT